jgi:hypothetical protein
MAICDTCGNDYDKTMTIQVHRLPGVCAAHAGG